MWKMLEGWRKEVKEKIKDNNFKNVSMKGHLISMAYILYVIYPSLNAGYFSLFFSTGF